MISEWITPGLVVLVGVALWRFLHTELRGLETRLRDDLGGRIDRLNDRIDRHLEGHA